MMLNCVLILKIFNIILFNMTQLAPTIISDFCPNKNTLFIILGEGKTCSVSRALWDYKRSQNAFSVEKNQNIKDKNKELYWISIDPIFDNWSGNNHPKKIKTSLLGQKAEEVDINGMLTKDTDIDDIVLISLNAHTHAGKFLDRLIISASKIFGKIKIHALCSRCHNPGLYKRQIKYTLKYPKIRRTQPEKHKGWLLDVDVSTNF